MSQNKVTFGLKNVHIAFMDTASQTQPAWKVPTKVPGAVRWSPEAQGDSSTFYADDMAYFVVTANNGYTGELEFANVPDAIIAEALGWEIDANGMIIEAADAMPKPFALIGEVQGDKRNRRFIYYNCQASRPAKERTTKGETIEPTTDVLNLTVSPIEIGGKTLVKGEIELSDTNSAAFNAFFTAVTVPTMGAVSKTGLTKTIALAGSLTAATYTTDSWAEMQTALTNANAVNTNAGASQAQVDAADKALEAAIIGLVVA